MRRGVRIVRQQQQHHTLRVAEPGLVLRLLRRGAVDFGLGRGRGLRLARTQAEDVGVVVLATRRLVNHRARDVQRGGPRGRLLVNERRGRRSHRVLGRGRAEERLPRRSVRAGQAHDGGRSPSGSRGGGLLGGGGGGGGVLDGADGADDLRHGGEAAALARAHEHREPVGVAAVQRQRVRPPAHRAAAKTIARAGAGVGGQGLAHFGQRGDGGDERGRPGGELVHESALRGVVLRGAGFGGEALGLGQRRTVVVPSISIVAVASLGLVLAVAGGGGVGGGGERGGGGGGGGISARVSLCLALELLERGRRRRTRRPQRVRGRGQTKQVADDVGAAGHGGEHEHRVAVAVAERRLELRRGHAGRNLGEEEVQHLEVARGRGEHPRRVAVVSALQRVAAEAQQLEHHVDVAVARGDKERRVADPVLGVGVQQRQRRAVEERAHGRGVASDGNGEEVGQAAREVAHVLLGHAAVAGAVGAGNNARATARAGGDEGCVSARGGGGVRAAVGAGVGANDLLEVLLCLDGGLAVDQQRVLEHVEVALVVVRRPGAGGGGGRVRHGADAVTGRRSGAGGAQRSGERALRRAGEGWRKASSALRCCKAWKKRW